jgi:hypothetical protein
MASATEIRRVLRITFDGGSIRGSLDGRDGRLHPFSGWLELLVAIDALRAGPPGRGPDGATTSAEHGGTPAPVGRAPTAGADPTPLRDSAADQPGGAAMSPTMAEILAPSQAHQIVIVERYNLSLVAARPAGPAIKTEPEAGLTGVNHNQIAPTNVRRQA